MKASSDLGRPYYFLSEMPSLQARSRGTVQTGTVVACVTRVAGLSHAAKHLCSVCHQPYSQGHACAGAYARATLEVRCSLTDVSGTLENLSFKDGAAEQLLGCTHAHLARMGDIERDHVRERLLWSQLRFRFAVQNGTLVIQAVVPVDWTAHTRHLHMALAVR